VYLVAVPAGIQRVAQYSGHNNQPRPAKNRPVKKAGCIYEKTATLKIRFRLLAGIA
jgi:hypothetical protein